MTSRELHHPVENYAPPRCPRCGTPVDVSAHHELVEPWLAGGEPSVACAECGQHTPLGDLPESFYVSELAVRFNNWPPLRQDFIADLGGRLGARWRVVYVHT